MRCALMLRYGRAGNRQCFNRIRVLCAHTHDRLATAGHAKHRHDRLQRYGFKRPSGARGFAGSVCRACTFGVSRMTLAQSGRALASHAIGRRFESGTSLLWKAQWSSIGLTRRVSRVRFPLQNTRERKLPHQEAPRAAPLASSRKMSRHCRSGSHAGSSSRNGAEVRRQADGVRLPRGGATVPRRRRQGRFHPINSIGHEKVYGRLSREGGRVTPVDYQGGFSRATDRPCERH